MTSIAIAGIDPVSRQCQLVGIDDVSSWNEVRFHKLIPVRVTTDRAREIWGEFVPDIYALASELYEIEKTAGELAHVG